MACVVWWKSYLRNTSVSLLLILLRISGVLSSSWKDWWSYDGIAGPEFWGVLNPAWTLCTSGKHQSPIDIDASKLVFDPNLEKLYVKYTPSNWTITNTGHDVTIATRDTTRGVRFTGGPLSYDYTLSHVQIHLGILDSVGSEHTFNGQPFPAEIQFVAYNSDLFDNFTSARPHPNSITIVSVMVQIQEKSNPDFKEILNTLPSIHFRGNVSPLPHFNISRLLPSTDTYFTYYGSFTQPACEEVVTWIVLNKPFFISKSQITALRSLTKSLSTQPNRASPSMVLMENNFRLPMPLHKRTVRTNVHMKFKNSKCLLKKGVEYKVNEKFRHH